MRARAATLRLVLAVFGVVATTLGAATMAHADDEDARVQLIAERTVGWTIGDIVPLTVLVDVDARWQLDRGALIRPGELSPWLELRSVDVSESRRGARRHYRLALRYQTFYAPIEATSRQIRGFTLILRDGERERRVAFPGWNFTMSALRVVGGGARTPAPGQDLLRPDHAVQPIPLRPMLSQLAVATTALLASLLLWAAHRGLWPFHAREARPFSRAARQLRRLDATQSAQYRQALRLLHRAFDVAAGRRLMMIDAQRSALPIPPALHDEALRFYGASELCFFADRDEQAMREWPQSALRAFSRELARSERGRA